MFIDAEKWLANYLKDGKRHEIKKLRDGLESILRKNCWQRGNP